MKKLFVMMAFVSFAMIVNAQNPTCDKAKKCCKGKEVAAASVKECKGKDAKCDKSKCDKSKCDKKQASVNETKAVKEASLKN